MSISSQPKKSLGQHFLTNVDILDRIVKAAEITANDTVVEVGPGRGSLTNLLIKTGAKIITVEKDTELALALREKYASQKNIEIIEEDILKFEPTSFTLSALCFTLIGNIPYYLTSHLLRIVLTQWPAPKTIVFMIQKEVAQRIVARPPNMNMLALLVQLYGTPKIISIVKRGSFTPAPKVDSAILAISKIKSQKSKVLEIAARGFAHPRKMIGSNLPKDLLIQARIDPARRPGTLTVDEWKRICDII